MVRIERQEFHSRCCEKFQAIRKVLGAMKSSKCYERFQVIKSSRCYEKTQVIRKVPGAIKKFQVIRKVPVAKKNFR